MNRLTRLIKQLNGRERFGRVVGGLLNKHNLQNKNYCDLIKTVPLEERYGLMFNHYFETIRYIHQLKRLKKFRVARDYSTFLDGHISFVKYYLEGRVQAMEQEWGRDCKQKFLS